jgi:hypothetical protein
MRKTFKYIYTDIHGRQAELTKAITDRMEPRDDKKKACAAAYFTEMLRNQFKGSAAPVVVRNIQEIN